MPIDISLLQDTANAQSILVLWLVMVGVILILMGILLIRLRKSIAEANENNARINQYLAAIPEFRIGSISAIYQNTKLDLGTALLLCFILGGMGMHKVYLGKKTAATLYFLFFWTLIPSLLAMFDAVNMPKTISEYNLSIIENLYNQIVRKKIES